jgi:hypothetical protein
VGGKQAYTYLYFGQSWHRGAAHMAWTQPDLMDVEGYDPGFLPQPGTPVRIQIHESGSRTGQLPVAALGQPAPILLARPPGMAGPDLGRAEAGARMQLRPAGAVAAPAAPAPWLEYWSVGRTQAFVP